MLKLLPGAVITGTIADHHGRPAAGVPVLAVDTRADAAAPARALTDDRGVPHLRAGARRLRCLRDSAAGHDLRVGWRQRGARGDRRAGALGAIAGRPCPRLDADGVTRRSTFPVSQRARAATRVAVTAGEEHGNIGFALQIVPTATIAGTLIDHTGQPLTAATVTLYPRKTDQPDASDAVFTSGAITLPRATVAAPKFSDRGVAPALRSSRDPDRARDRPPPRSLPRRRCGT